MGGRVVYIILEQFSDYTIFQEVLVKLLHSLLVGCHGAWKPKLLLKDSPENK